MAKVKCGRCDKMTEEKKMVDVHSEKIEEVPKFVMRRLEEYGEICPACVKSLNNEVCFCC
jgi:hypothetical protein